MDKGLTLVEHLEELRRRIIISVIAITLAGICAFPHSPRILAILESTGSSATGRLVYFAPAEALLIHIKIAFFAGLAISMPIVLCQLWAFISPAIDHKVKKRGTSFLIYSIGAFICGASFGFFVLLPGALKFLLSFSGGTLQPLISASSYISFVLSLTIGTGLVFEMPVTSAILSGMGVIDHRLLRKTWKYAVIVIFIIAAAVTPTPDIFNMTILAIPMLILYEVSIWVSKFSSKKDR